MKITEPGFYQQRDGARCEVVAFSRGLALGWSNCDDHQVCDAAMWRPSDGKWSTDLEEVDPINLDHDIVAPWQNPPETWEPTGRRKWTRCKGAEHGPQFWMNFDGIEPGWYTEQVEQTSSSGESRWIPALVESLNDLSRSSAEV